MFKLSIGPYLIQVERGTLPPLYAEYTKRAILTEEFDLPNLEREHCFVSVARATDWPQLIIAQSFCPSAGGFDQERCLSRRRRPYSLVLANGWWLTVSVRLSGYGKTHVTWGSGNGLSTETLCS